MTRKDTILIAVVINAGLLAVLFVTAVIYDTDKVMDQSDLNTSVIGVKEEPSPEPLAPSLIASAGSTGDEVDNVLNYYSANSPSQPVVVETIPETYVLEAPTVSTNVVEESTKSAPATNQGELIEVIVKKGDVLEKIAKANGTTVNAIKKANQLKNERLKIGQVLKIPNRNTDNGSTTVAIVTKKSIDKTENADSSEAVYHTIKSGDSPWKIAKQHSVKYEDILKLNGLDEEKARNLKIGDRVRVK